MSLSTSQEGPHFNLIFPVTLIQFSLILLSNKLSEHCMNL